MIDKKAREGLPNTDTMPNMSTAPKKKLNDLAQIFADIRALTVMNMHQILTIYLDFWCKPNKMCDDWVTQCYEGR